jgi:AraC-like DNA-binding protein
MPLAELALECGFSNQSHFTASFSRTIGIPPGRYRRDARLYGRDARPPQRLSGTTMEVAVR